MSVSSDLQLRGFISYCFLLVLTSIVWLVFAFWLYLLVGMAVLCLASRPHHGNEFHSLTLFLLNLMWGCFIWCLCHVSTLTFPWIPHRDIFLAEMVNEFTERLSGVEGLSTGKLNRGVSWSRVFQQNKAWGWRPQRLHRVKESQNHVNLVSVPNIQV